MPTYLYKHDTVIECNGPDEFEIIQPIKAEPLERCPRCNELVTRLIAGCSFTWKNGSPTPKHY